MSQTVIRVENISKQYRLGVIGSGTLRDDIARFWAKVRGKEDPTLKIGQVNDRARAAEGDYVWALKDVSFEVQQGEVLGIIGKNGAGKSTLLKILSRITTPTQGSIKMKGRVASLLEVGTGMHPELTGRENIFLNGAILGMQKSEIRKKLDEIIDFAGIAKYIDTPIKRYSSGMSVRLGFAVAAFLEPEILIVDEVLAVGDAEFQKKAIGKMQDISKGEGRTVLFVSHNMQSVLNLCTKAVLMETGSVTSFNDTQSIIDKYLGIEKNSNRLKSLVKEEEITKLVTKVPADLTKRHFQIIELSLQDEMQNLKEVFTHGEKVFVKLKVKVFEAMQDFRVVLSVFCQKQPEQPLLIAQALDSPAYVSELETLATLKKPLLKEFICEIPAFFLGENKYELNIDVYYPKREHHTLYKALTWSVLYTGEVVYGSFKEAQLRPHFNWSFQ
ncbi:ABC transporter ATP-binding protein [Hugenholtzia roseola]|uniref:ABC transporter ATP-binding protein n=1 Tax=Hugenholtzia roseola TaxID=1002 RepID=UPI00040549C8|nr:ABC transporter ATP-binding protein [Hugenholtzia roseola]